MSDTHFEVNKKVGYTVMFFLVISLITALTFMAKDHVRQNDDAKEKSTSAIQVNQEAIQESTKQMIANRTKIAVVEERVTGHSKNRTAHTN